MHTIKLEKPIDLGMQGALEAGLYMCDDTYCGHLMSLAEPETATVRKLYESPEVSQDRFRNHYNTRYWRGVRRLIISRPAAYGDLLFLTPAIREIKKRTPDIEILVSCLPSYRSVFLYNKNIHDFVPYPLPFYMWDCSFTRVAFMEGMIERHQDQKMKHAVDIVLERLGLETENKRMEYNVSDAEKQIIFTRYPYRGRKRIGIQIKASTLNRTYPSKLMDQVIIGLTIRGYDVFILGHPKQILPIKNGPKNLYNCSQDGLDFRESCALVSTCDAIIAPDSALCHVGGALGIPTVALYAAFPWQTRTSYHPSVRALSGVAGCAPCYHHKTAGSLDFPAYGPCYQSGQCDALATITPERIISAVTKNL